MNHVRIPYLLLGGLLLQLIAAPGALAWQDGYRNAAYFVGYTPYAYPDGRYYSRAPRYRYPVAHAPAARSRPATAVLSSRPEPRSRQATQVQSQAPQPPAALQPENRQAATADDRAAIVDRLIRDELSNVLEYELHESTPVPRIEIETLPEGFSGIRDTKARKQTFLRMLLPLVLMENERLLADRERLSASLEQIDSGVAPGAEDSAWLKRLARRYRLQGNPLDDAGARDELLKRLDGIPVSLALAQAATESAWGSSRFAREASNLFGIWTYDEAKGLVPKQRAAGKKHLVRKFDSFRESIRYYMHTLNSHPAYAELRDIRAARRAALQSPDGAALAQGLVKYSGIGEEYITIIRSIISGNDLASLDRSRLARS